MVVAGRKAGIDVVIRLEILTRTMLRVEGWKLHIDENLGNHE